ncbi:ShlB/FhaC/HecB family hemolysin secretion/activation protein [Apibacter raozihei]|uniref:BamA/TamA family outer membrane protein n=1 Tax=Apibacter raozihei TaxID=2500547 RepID=UPI000FE33668|nr:BamA/TamA family outer membrane protein [Apibacter raozihei]
MNVKYLFHIVFLLSVVLVSAQEQNKKLNFYTEKQLWFKISAQPKKINSVLDSLVNQGFYTLKIDSVKQGEKDVNIYITRGVFYKKVLVKLDSLSQLAVHLKHDYSTSNVDSLVNIIHYYYLKKGYAFNQITTDFNFSKLPVEATVSVDLNNKRIINSFVIAGYTNLPKGIKKELEYDFIGKPYEDSRLKEISDKLKASNFILEDKNPQVLFTPDSTAIYLYLKKKKASSFDGILGFGNDQNGKLKLNGQIRLSLGNIFNSFETINLNWLSTPEKSQNFDFQVHVPYLFKTKLGTETQLNIFKQDSTFANIKLKEHLYYQYSYNQRIGVEGSFENSRYVLNSDTINSNFSKSGLGLTYQYLEKSNLSLLGNKNLYAIKGSIFRNIPENQNNLTEYELSAKIEKLFKLSSSHYIKSRIDAATLLSDTLTINELYRLGGLKSIRGFNEQSIYANAYLAASLEYRYVPFEEMFFTVFADVAWTENKYRNSHPFLLGTGIGINFLTRFGIFSLNYAVGKYDSEPVNFSDSKVHIGIQASF